MSTESNDTPAKLWTQRLSRDPAERIKQSDEPHWSDLDPDQHRLPHDDETVLWESPLARFVEGETKD